MKIIRYVLFLLPILITSCNQGEKIKNETINEVISEQLTNKVKDFTIIFISPSGEKLINKKATEALGTTEYCSISPECNVKILEEDGEWVKIQVIEPDWLSDSHIGWVKKTFIDFENKKENFIPLDKSKCSIILQEKSKTVDNFYILLKTKKFDKKYVEEFANSFKMEYSKDKDCNIYIYDDKKVKPYIKKYPLNDKEYLFVADHFVGMLPFDDNSIWWFPFQDIKYKELGGKNWKKNPIN